MKRIMMTALMLYAIISACAAKNYLPHGSNILVTQIPEEQRAEVFYADLMPELYSYHAFGFTNIIFNKPNSAFPSIDELVLQKVDVNTYANEPGTIYFSYNMRGVGEYTVSLYGSDLTLQDPPVGEPCFSTLTEALFPGDYVSSSPATYRGSDGQYIPMMLMDGDHPALGSYGSCELKITASFIDSVTGKPVTDPMVKPKADGYFGDFRLVVMPKETGETPVENLP